MERGLTFDDLVEVTLSSEEDFLKVRETLTRIGVPSKKSKTLYQSCHILHKRGRYAIVHFKELFALDGKPTSITENDVARRNKIVQLLEEWGLVNVVDENRVQSPVAPIGQIKILSYKEKDQWILEPKFNIGRKKSTDRPV